MNKINFFFWTNFRHSAMRTGHYAWPHCSFSWINRARNHPSCCRTCCFLHPYHIINHDHGVNHLDDNGQVGNCWDCVGCFDGNCVTCDWAAERWAIFQSFGCFLSLAIFSRTTAILSVDWHCSKKAIILSGLVSTILFMSSNLFWCTLGYEKKICSLLSCAMGTSIVCHPQGSWEAALDTVWTYASAWVQASWLYKASKSAGCQCWGTWQWPQGSPWCTHQSLPLYNLHCLGIALQWCWSTWSDLHPESTDPWGWIAMGHCPYAHLKVESKSLTQNWVACMLESSPHQIKPGRAQHDQ